MKIFFNVLNNKKKRHPVNYELCNIYKVKYFDCYIRYKMTFISFHIIISLFSCYNISFEIFFLDDVLQLVPNVKYIKEEGGERFHIYCFSNVPKSILQIWRSVQVSCIFYYHIKV